MLKKEHNKLEKLQIPKIKGNKSQSLVVNNFFMLLTIGMVCFALLFWAYYIRPSQIEYEQKELSRQQYLDKIKAYQEQRNEQIKRSQIYNSKSQKNDSTY